MDHSERRKSLKYHGDDVPMKAKVAVTGSISEGARGLYAESCQVPPYASERLG